jgi:hypothetical protein
MPNKISIVAKVKDEASSGLDKVTDKVHLLSQEGAKGWVIGAGAALTAKGLNLVADAASNVTNFMAESIQKASDLNESMSKSDVVFGDSAGAMEQFGEKAATAFGMSEQAAIEAGASFGNFFEGAGIGTAKAEKMSEKIVALAGDLASFNNLDPADALQKLQSGLAGEAKPLRDVGVFLSDAAVKAKAMQMGLGDAHGELTEGEKILVRYQLILDQTQHAQGDFARTSDGLANSQRTLNAELDNTQAKFGEKLLPLQLEGTKAATGLLTQIDYLSDAYSGNTVSAQENADAAKAVSDNVAVQVFHLQGLADWLVQTTTAQKAEAESADYAATASENLTSKTDDWMHVQRQVPPTLNRASEATGDYVSWLWKMADAADGADKSVSDLSTELSDDLFGAAERKGKEADLKGQISDLEKSLKDTKDKNDATKIRGQIAGLRQELFDLHLEEAASQGPEAAIKFLQSIKTNSRDAATAIQKLIDKYRALIAVVPSGVYGGSDSRTSGGQMLAGGGVVPPGGHAYVGESAMERLDVDRFGNAIVTPLPGASRSRGTSPAWTVAGSAGVAAAASEPAIFNFGDIILQGIGSDVSPAAARGFAQGVRDEVATSLRDQTLRGWRAAYP